MKKIQAKKTVVGAAPDWATRQRELIDVMNAAAPKYQEQYTRADGTLIWREEFSGMDGSDDGYESFYNWPLFHALGGRADLDERGRFLWDAVTRQFTDYGLVWREFDGYYDWMHHGESYLYFYFFGLSNPGPQVDRARRLANMYTGDDPKAANWDPEKKIIRSPINGSRGPIFKYKWDDWSTCRWDLAQYQVPFDDLDVPTETKEFRGEMVPIVDWKDDKVYEIILEALNRRQMHGDVPLNLSATSLVTNAYIHTGDDNYKRWVLDYLEAWAERIKTNGGLCPDNVGHSGAIGETLEGKWWGGYYGWSWPHGFMNIIESINIAAMNAVLMTGDMNYLEIPRGQMQRMMEISRVEDGRLQMPHRHSDRGWTGYSPVEPPFLVHLWYASQDEKDRRLMEEIPDCKTHWPQLDENNDSTHSAPWYCYISGRNPDYPMALLKEQLDQVNERIELAKHDEGPPATWNVHHWQRRNPVRTTALVQLTTGGPDPIYHGGLLHARLRYFDPQEMRPGLPEKVAALVSAMKEDSVTVDLVNLDPETEKSVQLQAGAFAEHEFIAATEVGSETEHLIKGRYVEVGIPAGAQIQLTLRMRRYCHQPTYAHP